MTRRAYVYFVITFLIGVVVGGASIYYYAWFSGRWRPRHNENTFIHYMTNELQLSPPQVNEFRAIINDDIKQFHAIEAQIHPQIDALHNRTRAKIRKILTPEQVTKFNVWLQSRRKPPKRR